MPIHPEARALYPPDWPELSRRVRFERAGGRCQCCRRPHLTQVRCLPDGRWFDVDSGTWRDRRGRPARWPDLIDAIHIRVTRVVLAAAHLDNDPANNRLGNLRSLCQRCHMLHDRPFHLVQRWLTYRRRSALGDLFLGRYGVRMPIAEIFLATRRTRVSPVRGFGGSQADRTDAGWLLRRGNGRVATAGSAEDLFAAVR